MAPLKILAASNNDIAIYVHWPFCESKCPYCDFNSHVSASIDHDIFLSSYIKELDIHKDYLSGKTIKSIFFGGGTPSLAKPQMFEVIINHLSKLAHLTEKTEITIEANPGSSEINKFKAFRSAGINRISIGIQSFNDIDLKFLGRKHSAIEAKKALEYANQVFNNYSFDLIYALPEQTTDIWAAQLQEAFSYAKNHLSLYQLTIEKGTKFFKDHRDNKFTLPAEELAADLYSITNQITSANGLEMYEISNYAKPAWECAHNLAYWHYNDYLGIGPGAHGRITIDSTKFATMNVHSPEKWINLLQTDGKAYQYHLPITTQEALNERILMGLRLKSGLQINDDIYENIKHKLQILMNDGLIKYDNNHIVVTDSGRLLLNSVINFLL